MFAGEDTPKISLERKVLLLLENVSLETMAVLG